MKLVKFNLNTGFYVVELKDSHKKDFKKYSFDGIDFYVTEYNFFLNTQTDKIVKSKNKSNTFEVYVTLKDGYTLIDSNRGLYNNPNNNKTIDEILSNWSKVLQVEILKEKITKSIEINNLYTK